LSTELAWLAAHGLLHLLGWDHPDDEQLMQMLQKQVVLLNEISINIDIEY
jgi:probable rRNA maturation factor